MAANQMESRQVADEIVPGLPSYDYERLTVARVLPRLADLNPSQLRRVLDFERRHGNRQPVLDAIEQALAA
jgi:hypothetical protein